MDPSFQASVWPALQKWFPESEGYRLLANIVGHSQAKVFEVFQGEIQVAVLKCQPYTAGFNLHRESRLLKWLQGKVSAPRCLSYKLTAGWECMLMSHVHGEMSHIWGRGQEMALGTLLGDILRELHALSLAGCPYLGNLSYQAWKKLPPGPPVAAPAWDLVCSHGDFCLPNILLHQGQLAGLIDWSQGGVYDRYHDLYWAEWSLRYNSLSDAIPALWRSYGQPRDAARMARIARLQE